MALARVPKSKACKVCKARFHPSKPLQAVCGIQCAVDLARKARETLYRKQRAQEREKFKSRAGVAALAQSAFNAFIRARDAMLPCISCGQSPNQGQRHASHYRSTAAAPQLRFNSWNVHASCAQCNSMKSGNIVEYRIALQAKIGSERLAMLEQSNEIRKYDIPYLRRLQKLFNRRARHYRKLRGMA